MIGCLESSKMRQLVILSGVFVWLVGHLMYPVGVHGECRLIFVGIGFVVNCDYSLGGLFTHLYFISKMYTLLQFQYHEIDN